MKRFFQPNIDAKGRVWRMVWGFLLLTAAACAWECRHWIAWILAAAAAFTFYEVFRGWCLLRACGIRTKF